ncbi:unnamed protein product [Rhizoctonia solani]|uniref:Jacalin-type lectin domain-containing protein n=1 Tax=Rhizoctonia solani TaxID=456999 RepID=A0A8H3GZH8_9AGAM|nr:unnamed protein product [Rhizoctonia solani]
MSVDPSAPIGNDASLSSECTNNQSEDSNDPNSNLRRAGWLRGFRIDDTHGPRISAYQVASYMDRAASLIEETNDISTEVIVTNTKRETNYVHHGWSIGAITTISPWTSSRIVANNQPNAKGTWYTRITKIKRLKVEVLLEDLAPVPEFEAAIEDALRQPTTYEKFQAIYRTLGRWGDVVPLAIEIGSSLVLTDTEIDRLQFPESGERNYNSIVGMSTIKTADVTITGGELKWSDGKWATTDVVRGPQWRVIKIDKSAPSINLLARELQARLSELYAQRLSYVPPYGLGPLWHIHKTYDDNQHTLKIISSVMIPFSDFIELLTITYSGGTISDKHGGGGHVGTEHTFRLAPVVLEGEHITELIIWNHEEWIRGFQFITTMGRCSPQYGTHDGTPTVARSKSGVLVGFLIHTRNHPQHGQMYSGVQGVWRHDLVPGVPKEDDVYSEYYGGVNGRAFNDRALVGNSKSTRISSVEIRSGDSIDSTQFTYIDNKDGREFKPMTPRHGGPGGSPHQFVLNDGEHIVTVSGKYGEQRITQLCFGTNLGRTSEVYGGGKGQPFSSLAPGDKDRSYFRLQYICGKLVEGGNPNACAVVGVRDSRVFQIRTQHHINNLGTPHHTEPRMSFDQDAPPDNYLPLPPECTNNEGRGSNDNNSARWLRGFRIDDIHGPRISAHRVATYADGAAPFIEEESDLSTETIVTNTKREANYAHRAWSIGAIATISPWTSSRIAANNQPNPDGTWYTRLTKTKRSRVQVLLKDITPVPEFEAAIEDGLRQPTRFEQFQAIYCALDRWGDVVPLEIEIGFSLASTDTEIERLRSPETGEHNCNLLTIKAADTTITGYDLRWSNGNLGAMDVREPQWQTIKISKVAPTTSLLTRDIQSRLSELYAQRISYVPPYGIGRIRYWNRTYDDNQHASKTISSIMIRSSDTIELLSITYSDGTMSGKHGGDGVVGTEYKFILTAGEHITEMITWTDGDWLQGLQFVTNMGRCSPQYGAHRDLPSVARAKGGVLVGLLSQTKYHPEFKELFSSVQGIWRHDLLPKVPKEEDVYSEYFGDRNSDWNECVFNDRVLVGNSKSIHISNVKIWSGDSIDSIQFIYTDHKDGQESKSMTLRHGGPGGSPHQFVLEGGEHIVTVSGQYGGHRITQLYFGTNRGRTSEVYGAGKGQTFSSSAPRDKFGNYYRLQYICGKEYGMLDPVDPGLHGFRVDVMDEPQISADQAASHTRGAMSFVEEANSLSTETTVTNTERETNYVHRGWSIGAIRKISPWTSSRIAVNNQPGAEGTWYTSIMRNRRLKIKVLLKDLVPTPEFEAAIEEALRQPTLQQHLRGSKQSTTFLASGQYYYGVGCSPSLPFDTGCCRNQEIEIGSSIALMGEKMDYVQLPEVGGHNYDDITWLSKIKYADVTISDNPRLSDDKQAAVNGMHDVISMFWANYDSEPLQGSRWQRITIGAVAPTISLLSSDLQARLSELYAQRLSYLPLSGVGPIDSGYRTYDDNKYTSKTISSIKIRSSYHIELLSITYSDGTISIKHGGSGHVGTEYEFTLAIGEHISEMLIWTEGDWLFGLQFITTMGRCSPQYGILWGPPTVARTRGGVLVGFLSHTKLRPTHNEMFSSVQGIWRHDLVPRVPEEDDVYSEYFGDKNKNGRSFNDRVSVGNSNSIRISSVEVWSGEFIDSIQLTYTDNKHGRELKSSTLRHGGPGGSFRQFVLEDGEHIVIISGRQESHITQLCFGTNRGESYHNAHISSCYNASSRPHK